MPYVAEFEDGIEVDGVGVGLLLDIGDAIGAEDVKCEGAEPCDCAGIFADSRLVLSECPISDSVVSVFYSPVFTDDGVVFFGGAARGRDVEGDFLGALPCLCPCIEAFADTPHLNDVSYQRLPLGVGGEQAIEDTALAMLNAPVAGFRRGDECIHWRLMRCRDAAIIQ